MNILEHFAWGMKFVVERVVTAEAYRHDRLKLWILLTLSKDFYAKRLLYRELGPSAEPVVHTISAVSQGGVKRTERISEQAITYYSQVLGRPLTLAQNLSDAPTNMHRLFESLCCCGAPQTFWKESQVGRSTCMPRPAEHTQPSFQSVAATVAKQRVKLGEQYGEISHRRRSEFGPIWLAAPDAAAEMPEEMSLFDVMDAVPRPLNCACLRTSQFELFLTRAIKSLNERYMLLRACGLVPRDWLERGKPPIGELREMKKLRKMAHQWLETGEELTNAAACRRAFDALKALKGDHKKLAGCKTFDVFASTEHGMAMIGISHMSLDESIGFDGEDDERPRVEMLPQNDADPIYEKIARNIDAHNWVEALIDVRPQWFSPVMGYFFRAVLHDGRSLYSMPGATGVVDDLAFRRLVKQDSKLAGLAGNELGERLMADAENLIRRGRRLHGARGGATQD